MNKLLSLLAIVVTLETTAYTHSTQPTASGVMPAVGHCAVDKINGQWVPFGSKIRIIDQNVLMHELVVTDSFGGNYNNRMDIFMASEAECWQFGRRDILCEVEIP